MKFISNQRQKGKETFSIQIPKDYPWGILATLVKDLTNFLTEGENRDVQRIIRSRDFLGYLSLSEAWSLQSINSMDRDKLEIAALYQISSLLKKYPYELGVDRDVATFEKFFQSEDSCRSFNHCGYKTLFFSDDKFVLQVFADAKNFISDLIGSTLPDFTEMLDTARHGPGASLGTHNGYISRYNKMRDWPYTCTERCSSLATASILRDERWRGVLEDDYRRKMKISPVDISDSKNFFKRFKSSILKQVEANKVITVPKNSRINRTIAIEPLMNLYLQLGVDGFIRRRLLRVGINLNSQEKNQWLARLGSIKGSHSTIDLSAASDTISLRLCELLLPKPWYNYLLALRTSYGSIAKLHQSLKYEKISSMGNGYTFVLETLIFTALVHSVCKNSKDLLADDFSFFNDVAVYGDDIIVPTAVSDRTVRILNTCGFSVNEEKSFFSGPIRESCGTDWFAGMYIRPVMLSRVPVSVKDLFLDFNRFRRVSQITFMKQFESVSEYIMKYIPAHLRGFIGPVSDEEFDTYIHSSVGKTYVKSQWVFKRIISVNDAKKANHFGFRKLMNDLRGADRDDDYLYGNPLSAIDNFKVMRRNSYDLLVTTSRSGNWNDMYVQPTALKPRWLDSL